MIENGKPEMNTNGTGLTLALLIAAPLVQADGLATPMSASFLYAACEEAETNEYARGFCEGAIDALYSSMDEWCVPDAVTHGEVKEQVVSVLLKEAPPASRSAMEVVNDSVQQKWPCP
tara:strand:- start:5830 stop:6183 length:354 start_codon:yes stop_codon:yes gene_type:complete